MTPTDLRALAARVLGEEPSDELNADIWDALGLTEAAEQHAREWCRRNSMERRDYLLAWTGAFTTSHDAAFGAMPAGWRVRSGWIDDELFYAFARHAIQGDSVHARASSIPRAVTAAGLLARAAEMEAT